MILTISNHFSLISLDYFQPFHLLNSSLSLQTSFPRDFQPWSCSSSLVRSLIPHFIMHFIPFDLTFRIFWKVLGFFKIDEVCEIFRMGVAQMSLKLHALHHTCIITIFSCILDACYMCWTVCVLLGLDWAEPIMYLSLHVTCSYIFMHTYLHFYLYWYVLFCLSLFLPLSFFRLVVSWHLNESPLHPRTLCVLGHLLHLTLHHLLYGSVMIKP